MTQRRPRVDNRGRRHRGWADCPKCGTTFSKASVGQVHCSRLCAGFQPAPTSCEIPWRECGHCLRWYVQHRGRLYCSRRCSFVHHSWVKSGIERWSACIECGSMIDRLADVGGKRRTFCSAPCASRFGKRLRKHRLRTSSAVERFSLTEIAERDRWRCGLCSRPVSPVAAWPDQQCASLDHILPVSLGGTHTRANVQLAHWHCNVLKGAAGEQQLRLVG